MLKSLRRLAAAAVVALPIALPASAFTVNNPECLAPANPGGGWDFTCRTLGKLMHDLKLVPNPVQVTNMPGGVGAVAWSNVASRRADDPNLIVATSAVGVTQIAQNRYPSGMETMRWLAVLGTDVGVVMVRRDAPYQSLKDVVAALQQNPAALVSGGSSGVAGWDHLRLLMVLRGAGMTPDNLRKVRWVQYQAGSEAVTQLMGGHIGLVTTDIGEIAGFLQSGDVRPLAVLSENRLAAFPDIPTAREQGLDVIGYNWRGFYTGGKVSDAAYQGWVDILKRTYDSREWQEMAPQKGLTTIWRGGRDFEAFVREQVEIQRQLSREIGAIQ
jgi:putative tricarboxylic transport membrane protein